MIMIDAFEVDDDDHCESPENAYEDIKSCLDTFKLHFLKLKDSNEDLFIYDPFFCQGGMISKLNKLGYNNIYNKNEDFYSIQSANLVPNYDILITNPPYSLNHVSKLIQFVKNSQKPFMLLLPNYVYMKEYYHLLNDDYMFYIVPNKRYLYSTPYVSFLLNDIC